MSETATLEQNQPAPEAQNAPQAPDVNRIISDSIWGVAPPPASIPPSESPATPQGSQTSVTPEANDDKDDIVEIDDYFQREFGMNQADFKNKWGELNKPREEKPQEVKWNYDDSKEDEIYNYIHQKRELDKLEKYEVSDANQAAEIIRANLRFKYKDLSNDQIDRLFARQYALPAKPEQALDQTDEEYASVLSRWESQVQERQQDMMIDAKIAKPELAQYKSKIVLPEIQKPQVQQSSGPTQEELAAAEAGRNAYLGAVDGGYQNFKGFSVTAKDGDVQLPISYGISQEEQVASRDALKNLNVTEFFSNRWFDEQGNPRVTLMQEDLYEMMNRDKVHQKIANEAAAQMKAHMIKSQNNINLQGVNTNTPLVVNPPKSDSQQVAESIWKF